MSHSAPEVNRELTALLVAGGQALGFDTATEYAIAGGRLDVVWLWTPPTGVPGIDRPIPVVGIELESSWRTRKHVKGDLLNLTDAGVALGIIVLAGIEDKDDQLREFALKLVNRPGFRVLVWTGGDVRSFAAAATGAVDVAAALLDRPTPVEPKHIVSGKYGPLRTFLEEVPQDQRMVSLSFSDVDRLVGGLPPSATKYREWWANDSKSQAQAWRAAGWRVDSGGVDMNAGTVRFARGTIGGSRAERLSRAAAESES